jgi:hypothetical protein
MNKKFLFAILFSTCLPTASIAQVPVDKSQPSVKAEVKSEPKVQRWGSATLIMKDDKGNVLLNRTEKYPIVTDSNLKYDPSNWNENCWDWCRKVCDGYGVCWVSCGISGSPWTK